MPEDLAMGEETAKGLQGYPASPGEAVGSVGAGEGMQQVQLQPQAPWSAVGRGEGQATGDFTRAGQHPSMAETATRTRRQQQQQGWACLALWLPGWGWGQEVSPVSLAALDSS